MTLNSVDSVVMLENVVTVVPLNDAPEESLLAPTSPVLETRCRIPPDVVAPPNGLAVAAMAGQLYAASRRLQRVVATQGSDIHNLIIALDDMASAYSVQRWLWLAALLVVILALATTVVGH